MAAASISLIVSFHKSPLIFPRNLSTVPQISQLRKFNVHHKKVHNSTQIPFSSKSSIQNWRINSAISENFSLSEAPIPAETSDQIVSASTSDAGVTTIIQALLFVAFVGLSILTIGVIYIAVTDFLQKREKEKFEKEEAAKKKKKKKSGRKGKFVARSARAGPRGFGQKKFEETDDIDD